MKSLRVLLVFTDPPLPFGGAAARWFYVLLKGLVERGHRVTAFTPCSKPEEIEKSRELFPAPSYDLRLYRYPVRRGIRAKWETLRRPCSYIFSPDLWSDLNTERDRGIDVLHLETTWSGWLGEGWDSSQVVLNLHSLYDIDLANSPRRGSLDRLRSFLRRRAERGFLRSYPTLLTLTPRLKEAIEAIAPQARVHVVPLSLDLTLYPFIPAERRPIEPVIGLIGSMDWYPTHSAAVRLLTRLFPAIRQRIPHARLLIVGRNARFSLGGQLPQPGVEVAENVPEIQPYFERTAVLLYAPERGSGMKVKVLEAFAFGVPVVTTSEGVEGLPARDGEHAGVCDDDQGLVHRTVALLRDKARQERQRIAARQLVHVHCSPEVTVDGVERCYADMLIRIPKASQRWCYERA